MIDWAGILANEGPLVWRALWRLLGDRADVEECFQETFLAALVLSRREAVQSWSAVLCSLANARGLDRLRQRYRTRSRASPPVGFADRDPPAFAELACPDAGPVAQAIATELSERLRVALSQLPEKQAEMFVLHALSGWSHRQLAERMQMTENAVGVTLHRVRQRLRELLQDEE
jgi:RNA polymerase sigma-70 factor (ECF subfamily)